MNIQLQPRDRALIAGVAVLAVVAAFYLLAIQPQDRRASQLARQLATAQTSLTSAQSAYAVGRQAQARLGKSAAAYAAAQKAVPATTDVPGLLRLLQGSAEAAHVKIQSITPGSSSATSATAAATTGTAAASSTSATPNSVPISLTVDGGYQALNRLVQRLDRYVKISGGRLHATGPLIGISNVSLTGANSASAGGLSISLTATVYQTGGTASVFASGGTS